MEHLNPEIARAVTRYLDFGAMMRDISTLNKTNANIINLAFGVSSSRGGRVDRGTSKFIYYCRRIREKQRY